MYSISQSGLDVIVQISMEPDWPTKESILRDILELNRLYGFTRFALHGPGGGWRSLEYPPTEQFRAMAELFKEIREELEPRGIVCGWGLQHTIKTGPSKEFGRMVGADGKESPFSSCPLDPAFRKRVSSDMAMFARIARPAFIMTEDDLSIVSSTAGLYGCFCHWHLEEFARREGRRYTREDLVEIFSRKTEESYALLRRWRELTKDSQVGFVRAIREAVDEETPEIPIGFAQSGHADTEGDCTQAVCEAMAGPRHTPFARIWGTYYYYGTSAKAMPEMLYMPLYHRQHIRGNFHFLHETDTYPHTRFFTSGAHMRAMMGIVYSFGYEGSVFHVQQYLDDPNEETAYGRMYADERTRLTEAARVASHCSVKGVELPYDPFWNTQDDRRNPAWVRCIGCFGIPYTSLPSEVAFWDDVKALHADHETVMRQLSKGLFLDGEAARILCGRGYGAYLGVEIGENVAHGCQRYDLGEREVIREEFLPEGAGRNMPSAHMYAEANGTLLEVRPVDPACQVISEAYSFQKKLLGAAMTRFENALGGRVVVMGLTVRNNPSHALFNYRRQRLIQELVTWCADRYAYVREAPNVILVMNEAAEPQKSGFLGMLTLVNMCPDALDEVNLHIPPHWQAVKDYRMLDQKGEWKPLPCEALGGNLRLTMKLEYLTPLYILAV